MSISKNIDRKKVLLILDWCIKRFGKSRYQKDDLKLRVYKSKGISNEHKTGLRGTYYKGTICIYLGSNDSVPELCKTVNHEYKHYLLSEKTWEKQYGHLVKKGLSDEDICVEHPHEKICDKFEKKWGPICYKELKHKLYKKYL